MEKNRCMLNISGTGGDSLQKVMLATMYVIEALWAFSLLHLSAFNESIAFRTSLLHEIQLEHMSFSNIGVVEQHNPQIWSNIIG